jgi:hypothetical protein
MTISRGGSRVSDEGKLMAEVIGYCGQSCSSCPIYLAAKETDKEKQEQIRAGIAKSLEQAYGIYFEASDIADCDGCRTPGGRLFSACPDCKIRQCAKKKMVENCGFCPEYVCKELEIHFKRDPSAKARLDKERDNMFRSSRQKRDIKFR